MRRFVGTLTGVILAGALVPVVPAAGAPSGAANPRIAAPSSAANPAPVVVPGLREWHGATGTWRPRQGSRIVVGQSRLRALATRFASELRAESGVRVPVTSGRSRAGDVVLSLGSADAQLGDQGYALSVGNTAAVRARTETGVFYGTRTILQALKAGSIPRGDARDWPNLPERGQMLDVGRKYFPVSYLKQQIQRMAWYKLNLFHLHLSDWNGFRIESKRFPGLAAKEHYTRQELRDLQDYARRYDVTIVPEIDLPAHSVAISKYDPSLAFTCDSLSKPDTGWEGHDAGGWTLDVTKEHTRTFIHELLDDIIPIFDGPYFHIGGDEIPLDPAKNACPELVAYQKAKGYTAPGDIFTAFANELDKQVRAHGKTTQMWQWWDYKQAHGVEANKDIQVNEWLSSPVARAQAGYQVIGSQDGHLYVSPGFSTSPGGYGYADPRHIYGEYDFVAAPGIHGYKISRWSDKAEQNPPEWFDFFARRPIAALADRAWGAPRDGDFKAFLDRYDQVGLPGDRPALSQKGWKLVSASSQETAHENGAAANAFDNDPYTIWHSDWSAKLPQEITIDTGAAQRLGAFRYMPRQDGGINGRAASYELYVSADGRHWGAPAAKGTLPDTQLETTVPFKSVTGRYVRFRVLSEHGPSNTYASVAELDLYRG
ncbi:family 20 glycosylhydrolase [Actinoallomurus sp. CA-150999]|uniref:family 20 glycosylhydrolase n=1 Tax=Actinoallomurus sp. CA-150999 TaxID=3239887 RepID=UPI003D924E3E